MNNLKRLTLLSVFALFSVEVTAAEVTAPEVYDPEVYGPEVYGPFPIT